MIKRLQLLSILLMIGSICFSQTEIDGLMMDKNNLCVGAVYGYNSWNNYWEGSLKRDNANLGTVNTQMISVNANYGFSDKFNVIVSAPYVSTKASAGQLAGQSGLQDFSVYAKWMPVEIEKNNHTFSLYGIGGFSFPLTDYVADFLPMSIGLRSKVLSLRLMVDYQLGDWFATLSGAYMLRSNVTIDRNAYFTTEMIYSNQVRMPDAFNTNLRMGYRTERFIAEAILDQSNTLGGFDISRNNMPFLSNQMNATRLGLHTKYNFTFVNGLALVAGGSYCLDGRNVGQSTNVYGGFFYLMNVAKKVKTTTN
jgi:hypothetical protein